MLSLSIQRALYGGRKRDVLASLFNSSGEDIGPEVVTDGHFTTTATGWSSANATSVIVSGELEVTSTASGGRCEQNLTLVAGKTYTVTAKVRRGTATSVRVHIIRGAAGGYGTITGSGWVTDTTTKTISFTFTAPGTDAVVQLACNSAGTGYFDDVSIRSGTAQPKGFYYDPSDFIKYKASGNINDCTLFQDAAGTTPVTAVEQPVGLILDKSKGLVRGVELVTGSFTTSGAAYWSWNNTNRTLTFNATDATAAYADESAAFATLSADKSYEVTFDYTHTSGSAPQLIFKGSTNTITASTGKKSYIIKPGTSSAGYGVRFGTFAAGAGSVTNISVKELPGHHASQSTAASRPVLTARKNRLSRTDDFTHANWGGPNLTRALQADKSFLLTRTSTSAGCYMQSNSDMAYPTGVTVTGQIKAKKATSGNRYGLRIQGTYPDRADAVVNLDTGAVEYVGVAGTWTNATASATLQPDGFYLIRLTATSGSTPASSSVVHGPTSLATAGWEGVTAGLENAYAKEPQVEFGSTASSYQRYNTSTDYDWQGFPLWIKHDGVDDWLQTGSIDFTAYDKVTVVAGVTKLSDAARAMVVELGNTVAGGIRLEAPNTPASTDFSFATGGSVTGAGFASNAGHAAPSTKVIAAIGDIGADVSTLRLNGVQVAANNADQGTGNYANQPIYIGRRGGTSLPFNGQWSVLVGVATASPLATTTIQSAERKAASKTGVTIT